MNIRCLPFLAFSCLAGLFTFGQECNKALRPIVFVHGFLGAGDNYSPMIKKLTEAGYCRESCFVYDWNSMDRADQVPLLDKFIDSILNLTKALKVDLVGHSAGGGLGYRFLEDSFRLTKVERYVHIGSSVQKAPAGKNGITPTLNIFSIADKVVKGGEIPGATNHPFTRYDHFEVVTADSVAMTVFEFLNPGEKYSAKKLMAVPNEFLAKGRVITLGQNLPVAGAKLIVRNIHADGTPAGTIAEVFTNTDGSFQVSNLEPYKPYLFYCYPASGRAMVYYFSKINPHETLLYLRAFPNEGMVAAMLGNLPKDSFQSVFTIFSSQRAIQSGRDELSVNGLILNTDVFASPAKTAIAWFLFDGNKNGQTDFTPIAPFSGFPFMQAVDIMTAPGLKSATIKFGLHEYKVPALPASEAIVVVVL
jgi:hypothetical protein